MGVIFIYIFNKITIARQSLIIPRTEKSQSVIQYCGIAYRLKIEQVMQKVLIIEISVDATFSSYPMEFSDVVDTPH